MTTVKLLIYSISKRISNIFFLVRCIIEISLVARVLLVWMNKPEKLEFYWKCEIDGKLPMCHGCLLFACSFMSRMLQILITFVSRHAISYKMFEDLVKIDNFGYILRVFQCGIINLIRKIILFCLGVLRSNLCLNKFHYMLE